jgi:hypothetical protein
MPAPELSLCLTITLEACGAAEQAIKRASTWLGVSGMHGIRWPYPMPGLQCEQCCSSARVRASFRRHGVHSRAAFAMWLLCVVSKLNAGNVTGRPPGLCQEPPSPISQ